MGFPFDRIAKSENKTTEFHLKDFLKENMMTQDVAILHTLRIPITPLKN